MSEIAEKIKEFKAYWKIFENETDTRGVTFEEDLLSLLEAVAKEQRKSCGEKLPINRARASVFDADLVTDKLKELLSTGKMNLMK